ncbi:MAG: TauD/TfdA family dioxygenase [Rhodospirillales bacterium]|nr:TauD/TfdA family dioxygenase [Rhodospirillales bacterium]
MTLEIYPLGEMLGAEIRGLDPSQPIPRDDQQALNRALQNNLVLIIRGFPLTDPELISYSRVFGELDPPGPNPYGETLLPDYPELNVISNVIEKGRPIGNLGAGEAVWHADLTYVDQPPKAGVLHALELPPAGGNTYFANMYAAYEALTDALKSRIQGLSAIHDAAHNSAGMLRKGYGECTDVRQTPGARHPLVRTATATGRKALFLGRRPHSYIPGLELEESEALLDQLWAHATQPRFAFSHEWRVADTLIWNNLSVLHRRDAFDSAARRILHRAQIRGDELIL